MASSHSIKVLKGPRQAGKTSLLVRLGGYTFVSLDDIHQRALAQEDPVFFLDQFTGKILLDEATLVPALFPELKRRADAFKAARLAGKKDHAPFDVWITGSNQTLLQKSVRESLAGRASYFDLNTLSLHEMPKAPLADFFMKGGWPELHANVALDAKRYLDDLISTFIEKDIVVAAGIERKAAFLKATALAAGRVGQLFNASDIARNTGVETTTVQSWMQILQDNGIVRLLQPYFNNRSQRFIKTPKIYFQDTGLATRLQGWSE
ncbi:MAG TPA: AAA family ATPase, partial [Turneriella sp.]|nr:AAA family ATPase [Turneriella sp.]